MAIRYLSRVIGLSFILLAMIPQDANAAAAATVGAVLGNVTGSLASFPNLLSGAAYILGLLFTIQGVLLFKDHVDGGSGTLHRSPVPISAGVKRFLAGGGLFALPFMSGAVTNSLCSAGGGACPMIGYTSVHGAPGGNGMDQMIFAFISNIAQPATYLILAFSWISAIILLVTAIIRLTHTAQEGPRGPAGLGTLMTFLASGALFSFGGMIGNFSNSLFGSNQMTTYANINVTGITQADVNQIAPVIEALMTFIMIVGFIAFLRGWFVLKAFADGNSQVSIAQALTFLIGGTLAINLGALVNVLEQTVGVNTITFS